MALAARMNPPTYADAAQSAARSPTIAGGPATDPAPSSWRRTLITTSRASPDGSCRAFSINGLVADWPTSPTAATSTTIDGEESDEECDQ
jgi:hypothetical protein